MKFGLPIVGAILAMAPLASAQAVPFLVATAADGDAVSRIAPPPTPDDAEANFAYRVTVAAVSAVPEPLTWAMLIVGFGLIGVPMRRRANARVRYTHV